MKQTENENNKENWPVCPECIGLTGSIKRNWMENHADYIVSTYETMGLEYTCHYFISKSDTILSFLKRHDLGDKKLIRQDEITRNRVYVVDEKVNEVIRELNRKDISITELQNRGYSLLDIMKAWHMKQAQLNEIMVGALDNIMSNFTEHIDSRTSREVNPTLENLGHKETKQINVGPTSNTEVDRLFISSNKRTGKLHTSRSGKTHGTLRERYQNAKRRYRSV